MKENKEMIKYFYEVIVSGNRLEELPKYVLEDCIWKLGKKVDPIGLNGMKQHLLTIRKTYPDYIMEIVRQYSDGDYVISEFMIQGTHRGEFVGIKPTNRQLLFTGVEIDKVIDGKIVEHGGAINTFGTFLEHRLIRTF